MSKESISKVYLILEKIEYIQKIVENSGSITKSLEMDYLNLKNNVKKLLRKNLELL